MNNYWTHLSYEIDNIHTRVCAASRVADTDERQWQVLSELRQSCERYLEHLRAAENEARERFRASHRTRASLRSQQGEVEEEFFRTGEEVDDWFRHQ